MINIGQYSIRKKLTWMNVLVSGATLLAASSAFVAYELATLRLEMVRNMSIQARIVGANCASAILFADPDSARNTLSALNAAPNILSVVVYTPAGEPFAVYARDPGEVPETKSALIPGQGESHRFTKSGLVLTRPIVFQGKTVGMVVIAPTSVKSMIAFCATRASSASFSCCRCRRPFCFRRFSNAPPRARSCNWPR